MGLKHSKLSDKQVKVLVEHFAAGTPARTAGEFAGIHENSALLFYHRLRQLIYRRMLADASFLDGEIEADESYFGGVRKGKRGRGAAGKVAVFGLLKRGGRVFTIIIDNASSKTLLPIIRSNIEPDSIIYTDSWRGYNVLDVSEFYHMRINHNKEYVDINGIHINGIENFWRQSKRHLSKYNGIASHHFNLFLKECEWRFNEGGGIKGYKQLMYWLKTDWEKILLTPMLGVMAKEGVKGKPVKGAKHP